MEFKVGQAIHFDILDYRDFTYHVKRAEVYKRWIGSEAHFFTDYILKENMSEQEMRLRCHPDFTLLLSLYIEIPFDEGFQRVVEDSQGKDSFNIDDEQKQFYRSQELDGPYANVAVMNQETLVVERSVSYWDYFSNGKDEAGQPTVEYLIIERKDDNGLFSLYRGMSVDNHNIW